MNIKNLFFCALFFNLGLSLMAFLNFSLIFFCLCGLGFSFGLFVIFKKKFKIKFFFCWFLSFCFGVAWFVFYDKNFRVEALKFNGLDIDVCAQVVDVKKFDSGSESYTFKISEVEQNKLHVPFYVNVNSGRKFKFYFGDCVSAKLRCYARTSSNLNFGFNKSKAKNIYLNGKVLELFDVCEGRGFFIDFANARLELLNAIDRALDEPTNFLVSAIFLGQVSRKIPYNLQRSFGRCGLAHIFAVSGLHISILFSCIFYFLKRLKLSNKIAIIFLTLFLVCYNILLGFCVSAIRASLMNLAYLLGNIFKKKISTIKLLCFSATIILVVWPSAIFSYSFILSFASCLGIALFFKPISQFISNKFLWFSGCKKMMVDLFALSISSIVFSSIFLALFFGQISLIAPVVNLIVMPFMPIILIFSGCLVLSSFFDLNYFLNFFACCCEGIFFEIVSLVNFFAYLPFCCVPMRYFIAPFIVIGLVAFLTFVFFYAKSLLFSRLVAYFCAFIILIPTIVNYLISFKASCVSLVGNGLGFSVVISSLNKIIVLCSGQGTGGEKSLCQFLDSKGISQIDFLIMLPKNYNEINYDVSTIVDCFKTFCVMMPKSIKNSNLVKSLLEKGTYVILEEQARFENFPVCVEFVESFKKGSFNSYINIGGLDFSYCHSAQEFLQMQKLKFANVFIVDDVSDKLQGFNNCGFVISLKRGGMKQAGVTNVNVDEVTEFVIHGSYIKKGVL